jgi:hypothetical protein
MILEYTLIVKIRFLEKERALFLLMYVETGSSETFVTTYHTTRCHESENKPKISYCTISFRTENKYCDGDRKQSGNRCTK